MQGPYIKVTSDAMKIKVSTVVIQYCVYFDFHCIRYYLSLITKASFFLENLD